MPCMFLLGASLYMGYVIVVQGAIQVHRIIKKF